MSHRLKLAMILAACSAMLTAEQGGGCGLGDDALRQIVPTPAEDLHCVETHENYVVSWTTRSAEEATSHLRLVRVQGGSVDVLQKIDLRGGFGSGLDYSRKLAEQQRPFLIVVTQYGAAAAEIRVMAAGESSLHVVFEELGDYVDFFPGTGTNSVISVHKMVNGIDVPDLYEFRLGRFVNCNSLYPDYYRKLVKGRNFSADTEVSPSLVLQLARLLRLSGDAKGAERLLERYGRR